MLWISFCQKTETMMLVYYIVPLIKKNKNKLYQSVPDSPQMQLCYWYEKPIWYPSWVLHIWHGFFHLLIFNLNFFFKSYNTAFLSYCVFKTWLWYEIFSRCMYGFNLKTLIFILVDLSCSQDFQTTWTITLRSKSPRF